MPTQYERGRQGEYYARGLLKKAGWIVMRSYASKGAYDLVAIKRDRDPALIQVKSSRQYPPTLSACSPAERGALLVAADAAGAEAIFCGYHRGNVRWLQLLGVGLDEVDPWNPHKP